ncbi:hypothetical protein F5B18DRAFT_570342 [Nemania serpens]|nr:hypothetical protein F5B18DRAFT_570342 [Nemania serpens]
MDEFAIDVTHLGLWDRYRCPEDYLTHIPSRGEIAIGNERPLHPDHCIFTGIRRSTLTLCGLLSLVKIDYYAKGRVCARRLCCPLLLHSWALPDLLGDVVCPDFPIGFSDGEVQILGAAGFMLLRGGCGCTDGEAESPISRLKMRSQDHFSYLLIHLFLTLQVLLQTPPISFTRHPISYSTPVVITRAFQIQPPPILPFVVLPNFRNGSSELPKRASSAYGLPQIS